MLGVINSAYIIVSIWKNMLFKNSSSAGPVFFKFLKNVGQNLYVSITGSQIPLSKWTETMLKMQLKPLNLQFANLAWSTGSHQRIQMYMLLLCNRRLNSWKSTASIYIYYYYYYYLFLFSWVPSKTSNEEWSTYGILFLYSFRWMIAWFLEINAQKQKIKVL